MINEKSCKDCASFKTDSQLRKDNTLRKFPYCNRYNKELKTLRPCDEYNFKYKDERKNLKTSIVVTAISLGVIASDIFLFPGFNFGWAGVIVSPFAGLAIGLCQRDYSVMKKVYGKDWRKRV